jgi:hypothetical protein
LNDFFVTTFCSLKTFGHKRGTCASRSSVVRLFEYAQAALFHNANYIRGVRLLRFVQLGFRTRVACSVCLHLVGYVRRDKLQNWLKCPRKPQLPACACSRHKRNDVHYISCKVKRDNKVDLQIRPICWLIRVHTRELNMYAQSACTFFLRLRACMLRVQSYSHTHSTYVYIYTNFNKSERLRSAVRPFRSGNFMRREQKLRSWISTL